MNHQTTGYIGGTCNIGPVEVRRRIRNGYLGLAFATVGILAVEVFDLPKGYRLGILPGLFYGISGFIQAREKFCYLYGWLGLFSMTGRKHLQRVNKEYIIPDRMKAIRLLSIVLLLSGILTALYYFL